MARKRMFDKEIINQDSFLELPMDAKALYFLLGMEADDEGFVSYKKVLRLYGGTEDSIKILILKNYIIPFKSGVVVITDWKKNNYLDKNKIKKTIYQNEKSLLTYDEDLEQYRLNQSLNEVKPKFNKSLPSIEENRVEENRLDIIYGQKTGQNLGEKGQKTGQRGQNKVDFVGQVKVLEVWETQFNEFYRAYPKKVKKQNVKNWFKKNKPSNELFSCIMKALEQFRASEDWQKDGRTIYPISFNMAKSS